MTLTKKHKIIAGAILAVGLAVASYFGAYKAPSADAKLIGSGDLPSCEAGCDSQAGCFCNRSCFLAWCWGPWYCQCHDDAAAAPAPKDAGMSAVPATLSPEATQ